MSSVVEGDQMEPIRTTNEEEFIEVDSSAITEEDNAVKKPFVIGSALLGIGVILSILTIIAYVVFFRPKTNPNLSEQEFEMNAKGTASAILAVGSVQFEKSEGVEKAPPKYTATSQLSAPTTLDATPTIKPDDLVILNNIKDPAIRTATVAAFQTMAAGTLTGTPGVSSTPMPTIDFGQPTATETPVASQPVATATSEKSPVQPQPTATALVAPTQPHPSPTSEKDVIAQLPQATATSEKAPVHPVATATSEKAPLQPQPSPTSTPWSELNPVETQQSSLTSQAATQTQIASPTSLPTAGIMNELRLPAIILTAAALLMTIFFVRFLRFSKN